MKDETASVAIEEFVGLKPKMYSYLVDDNSGHKMTKNLNKNKIVFTISNNKTKTSELLLIKFIKITKLFVIESHHQV